MKPVRRLADELVERHLWPVALALVVALIAIPLIIGGGSSEPDPSALAVAAADAARIPDATPTVVLVGPPAVRTRPGKLRDPFRRTAKAKAAKKATSSSSSSSSGSGSSSSSSSSGSSSSGSSSGSGSGSSSSGGSTTTTTQASPPPPPPPAPPTLASRSVYVTVASVSGPRAKYRHSLKRLSVVGDSDNPALMYIGVSRGGEYAIFLLGPNATAGGDDGACIVADTCRAIGLRKGDALEVEVTRPGMAAAHYKLEIGSLRRVARGTAAAAKRDRVRIAAGGREALHVFSEDGPTAAALAQLRYGRGTGTVALVRSP